MRKKRVDSGKGLGGKEGTEGLVDQVAQEGPGNRQVGSQEIQGCKEEEAENRISDRDYFWGWLFGFGFVLFCFCFK